MTALIRPPGELSRFSGGTRVVLADREQYDFSYLGSKAKESIVLADALDVSFVTRVVLVVRIHVNNIGTGAQIGLDCLPTAPSNEDPQEFTSSTQDLRVTVSTQAAPFYLVGNRNTPPNGAWWKVLLSAHQTSSPVTIAAQLSVFLELRNG